MPASIPITLIRETEPAHTRIAENILQTIGHTPMVRLNRVSQGLRCVLAAKLEFLNPGGSVKDRIALGMIEEAEMSGRVRPGGTIVEATSGNTGVGLAVACAIKGYKAVFVMPDKMSQEKIRLLRAFGARVIITPTAVAPDDPRSYYSVSRQIVADTPNSVLADQYHNPMNPQAHYETTGPEIWEQTGGCVTDVVCGMGTGGTITGVARFLKERNPRVKMVGIDPVGSLLYETWRLGHIPEDPHPKTYKIEGIGEDFLPTALDLSLVDEVIQIGDKESFLMTRRLVREEGIFCGGSSGTAVAGALHFARDLGPDRLVVIILPDSGSRYLSKVFDDEWMRENGFLESTWVATRAADVLAGKAVREVYTARATDRMTDVIALMKQRDVSQLPIVGETGDLEGQVSEVDLLNHLLRANHHRDPDESIEAIVNRQVVTIGSDTPLEAVMAAVASGQAAIVVEERKVVGILTKIDILDYLSAKTK
ncbi:MAG: cystathionine beta-synthase [Chloroflexi bacterium]|nr:cystathionine beta-synthase [Chloroflexota bacterium]